MRPGPLCVLLACSLLLAGCRAAKPVAETPVRELPPRPAHELHELLLAGHAPDIRSYSAKADISLRTATESRSFKAHVRAVRDSAVWLSITPALGIEVARALVTRDSVKLLDKLHDSYWLGDTAQAQARFGMQPGLKLLQEALLGLPIGLDPEEKFR